MLAGGFEERVVPFQFGEIVCGALAVEQLKKLTLGFVALQRLRLRASGCGTENCKRCDEACEQLCRGAREKVETFFARPHVSGGFARHEIFHTGELARSCGAGRESF